MATQWTNTSEVLTSWTSPGTTSTMGTPIGLLMGITREITVFTPGVNPTSWANTTIKATSWNTDLTPSAGIILMQDGISELLYQNGIDTLGLQ